MANNDDFAGPHQLIEPGEYPCTWFVDGRQIPGSVELKANQPPVGFARFDLSALTVNAESGEGQQVWPANTDYARVDGYLEDRSLTVVLLDVLANNWYMERTTFHARFALVGTLNRDDAIRFNRARFQITGLHKFSGITPLSKNYFPTKLEGDVKWAAHSTGENLRKEWSADGASIAFKYFPTMRTHDPYQFIIKFAPWLMISVDEPVTVEEFWTPWCQALQALTAAATGQPERVTYLELRTEDDELAIVFASPISQEPYHCPKRNLMDRVAFTASDEGYDLIESVITWHDLRKAEHALIAGFNPKILTNDQHPRSRVLQLLQWLEASYGFEQKQQTSERQEKHTNERDELLKQLKLLVDNGALDNKHLKFAKQNVSKYVNPGLADALHVFIERYPELEIENRLAALPLVVRILRDNESAGVIDAVRITRNGLSHGTADYDVNQLRGMSDVLYILVRAEFLRLLGGTFDARSIGE